MSKITNVPETSKDYAELLAKWNSPEAKARRDALQFSNPIVRLAVYYRALYNLSERISYTQIEALTTAWKHSDTEAILGLGRTNRLMGHIVVDLLNDIDVKNNSGEYVIPWWAV